MAAIKEIVRKWADEIRDGIAWVIIWKNGRSWNAQAVWLNPDTDTFEPEDMTLARKILVQDPNAVMLNGYYCGHLGENMTVAELTARICWHYENGCNMLKDSTAFSQKSKEDSKENTEQKQEIEKTTRTLLRVHEDVHTVPEAIGKMVDAYAAEGYQVERLSSMNFKIILEGGWVHIYWQDGRIWQEIIKENKMVAEKPEKVKNSCEVKQSVLMGDMEEVADSRGSEEKIKQDMEENSIPQVPDSEDKETICRLLCEVLQKTRGCSDLLSLNLEHEDEIVTATFKSGSQKINIACDSGMAMIRDIVNHLRC